MPPGSVAMPRDWACGSRPDCTPYDSGANSSLPAGTNAGSTLKRLASGMSSAVPLTPSRPGMDQAVAALVLDAEQIDRRRVLDPLREVAADADRGDEAGAKRLGQRAGRIERVRRSADWARSGSIRPRAA